LIIFLQKKGLDAVYGQIGIKLNSLEKYVDNLVKKNPTIDKILADEISASPIKVIKDVIKEADGKGLSIEALNSVRGALLTIDRAKGSFSGKQGYYLKQTLDEIDKIFDDLASGNSFVVDMIKVGPGRQSKAAIKNVSKAAQMIRGYNADYKAAVQAFNDPVIAKITHDAARGAFDVDTIFNQVVKNNRPELINKVINALPSEAEKKLVLEGLRENIIKNAVRDSIDVTTNEINPVFFAKHFSKLRQYRRRYI
jgi:leucyl aminopeptidase